MTNEMECPLWKKNQLLYCKHKKVEKKPPSKSIQKIYCIQIKRGLVQTITTDKIRANRKFESGVNHFLLQNEMADAKRTRS